MKKLTIIIVLLFTTLISYSQVYSGYVYSTDYAQSEDSSRHHTFQRIVIDGAEIFAIMNTVTYYNDTPSYSFPVFCKLDTFGNMLLQTKDSLAGMDNGYSGLVHKDSFIFWAGWQSPNPFADSAQRQAVLVKTDRDLNVVWRQPIPSNLKYSGITQMKLRNDTLLLSLLQSSPYNNAFFPYKPVRTSLLRMDLDGNMLSTTLQSPDTNTLYAGMDFYVRQDGGIVWAGGKDSGNHTVALAWKDNWQYARPYIAGNNNNNVSRTIVADSTDNHFYCFGTTDLLTQGVGFKLTNTGQLVNSSLGFNHGFRAVMSNNNKFILVAGTKFGNNAYIVKINLGTFEVSEAMITSLFPLRPGIARLAPSWDQPWDSAQDHYSSLDRWENLEDLVPLPDGGYIAAGSTF